MNLQAPNFDFIAVAGQQAGNAVHNYRAEKKVEEKEKADKAKVNQIYNDVLAQTSQKYMQETGETDPVKVMVAVNKFFPGGFKNETPEGMYERMMKAEPLFNAEIERVKEKKNKTTSLDLQKKISGQYGPEVYQAVMGGNMSPQEISAKYGVQLDTNTYNQIAGLQVPKPVAGVSPKIQAAADQPMSQERAIADTGIAQPMKYSQAQHEVMSSGLPSKEQETFAPLLTAAANRQTAEVLKSEKKPSETEFLANKLQTGEPIDEGTKAAAAALRAESTQGNKAEYNKMRRTEQQVSLLKVYMQDWKNRKQFEKDYGDAAASAVDKMYELTQKRLEIENKIVQAQNWTDFTKPAPDVIALQEMSRQYGNQIDQLRSKIPDLELMSARIATPPTQLTPPQVTTPGKESEEPKKKTGARKPLSAFER